MCIRCVSSRHLRPPKINLLFQLDFRRESFRNAQVGFVGRKQRDLAKARLKFELQQEFSENFAGKSFSKNHQWSTTSEVLKQPAMSESKLSETLANIGDVLCDSLLVMDDAALVIIRCESALAVLLQEGVKRIASIQDACRDENITSEAYEKLVVITCDIPWHICVS